MSFIKRYIEKKRATDPEFCRAYDEEVALLNLSKKVDAINFQNANAGPGSTIVVMNDEERKMWLEKEIDRLGNSNTIE